KPSVQVFNGTSSLQATLADLEYGGSGSAFTGLAAGRVAFADNRHGTVAVIDPGLAGPDLQIDAVDLPDGVPGVAYGPVTLSAKGGTGPFLWEVVSGALPPGLALDPASGAISGTP